MQIAVADNAVSATQDFDAVDGLPEVSGTMTAPEVRQVSKVMFARLQTLEEGTADYQYVRNTLIEMNTALVHFAARRFSQRADQMEDILQVGTIGLIKAVDRFDPDYGVEFVTFALPTILGEMKRFFRDTSWSVHVPRRLQELRIDLAKATDLLAVELDRAPTVAELAARLEIGEDEVVEAMTAANAYSAASLDAPATEEGDHGSAWADRLGYDDGAFGKVEEIEAVKPLIRQLSERERLILSLRFVQDMTQAQIGAELGVSQMQVSRLLTRILGRLRTRALQ
ncbi:RNA polymerase sigma factor SigF [Streptomyces sp. MI02-7b]|uniref:RNA polymerase sigma factor SigF n=1 Tax=Streptomyces sp. MI02-7b TaxID=462941 RepID=UPI0029B0A574|nr:RNA polymerase sigma factor SigF [Streptomyces sp. MI02-7b]MDX3071051.1 RNA polymerase sigma factor SigF [Streptomyces sp. MI02-7b]